MLLIPMMPKMYLLKLADITKKQLQYAQTALSNNPQDKDLINDVTEYLDTLAEIENQINKGI